MLTNKEIVDVLSEVVERKHSISFISKNGLSVFPRKEYLTESYCWKVDVSKTDNDLVGWDYTFGFTANNFRAVDTSACDEFVRRIMSIVPVMEVSYRFDIDDNFCSVIVTASKQNCEVGKAIIDGGSYASDKHFYVDRDFMYCIVVLINEGDNAYDEEIISNNSLDELIAMAMEELKKHNEAKK
jgi:hypothetical protein